MLDAFLTTGSSPTYGTTSSSPDLSAFVLIGLVIFIALPLLLRRLSRATRRRSLASGRQWYTKVPAEPGRVDIWVPTGEEDEKGFTPIVQITLRPRAEPIVKRAVWSHAQDAVRLGLYVQAVRELRALQRAELAEGKTESRTSALLRARAAVRSAEAQLTGGTLLAARRILAKEV